MHNITIIANRKTKVIYVSLAINWWMVQRQREKRGTLPHTHKIAYNLTNNLVFPCSGCVFRNSHWKKAKNEMWTSNHEVVDHPKLNIYTVKWFPCTISLSCSLCCPVLFNWKWHAIICAPSSFSSIACTMYVNIKCWIVTANDLN